MKTIVVPIDFSTISLNAVNYAADLAVSIGTGLSLIHVLYVPITFSEVPATVYSVTELIADAEEEMKKLCDDINQRTGNHLKLDTAVLQGDVVGEIDRYCSSVETYAVVMGAENTNAFERFMFGGKTVTAIRQLKWPIIVVPPGVKFASLRKIGLACDFRKVIDSIPVKEIKSLVKEFNAEFHVVHVNTDDKDVQSPETIEESAWLQEIVGDLNPTYDFIQGADIEKSLCEFAEKNHLDLLMIVPKKHNIISDFFQHSHSKRVVLHTHVPIMSIHE